ncbi:NAD-dependent epimerase/dehydratase family protein [Betaproteobacteria bacterium SCN2]|jgi:nucleoside-diphosphate-sugar epimerase|nr:NAD-dependent epimerase/dehydratase family protein [Betaproteobacteria bacterium SCN2]
MKKHTLLIAGMGDIGRRLAAAHPELRILGIARSAESAALARKAGATPIPADLDRRSSLVRLAGLAPWVLHLAPPPADSDGDPRTRQLIAALAKRGSLPRRLVYISTSGVYGNCNGERVFEHRPTAARNARARRRVDAERQLRRFAARNGIRLTILRAPGIYAADRLPLERIRKQTPAVVGAEDSYTNHIHADDLARLTWLALFRGKPNRVYHAVDDSVKKMGDYFDMVADHFGLPRSPRISRAEAQQVLSPALLSFLNESRILDNTRLKTELRAKLSYPDVGTCLAEIPPRA